MTYLPQFFGAPVLRIGHGLVLGAGLVLLGLVVARAAAGPQPDRTPAESSHSAGHRDEVRPRAN